MAKKKEVGFRDGGYYAPEEDEMRPSARTPAELYGEGREVLRYAHGDVDFAPAYTEGMSGDPSRSPASARYTPGMPTRKPKAEPDDEGSIITRGIPRN